MTFSSNGRHIRSYQAPKENIYPDDLLQEPKHHASRTGAMEAVNMRLRGGRSNLSIVASFLAGHEQVRNLIEPSSLLDLLSLDYSHEGNQPLLRALAERWWDTTDTFHFPCGEMTVTPLDLSMLTGLHFRPRPLEFYPSWIDLTPETMIDLIGVDPPRGDPHVPRTWLRSQIELLVHLGSQFTDAQAARLVVLMILGCSFCHTRRDTIDMNILRSLEDLSVIGEFDWGGAALCVMYREMSDFSRGVFSGLGGTHIIWEFWAYEYFPFLSPPLRDSTVDRFPSGCAWHSQNRTPHQKRSFLGIRAFFSRLEPSQVQWTPFFDKLQFLIPMAESCVALSSCRLLLRFRSDRMFYLGERVRGQIGGERIVPVGPPIEMRYGLRIQDQDVLAIGLPIDFFLDPDVDYNEFCRRSLMPGVPFLDRPVSSHRTRSAVGSIHPSSVGMSAKASRSAVAGTSADGVGTSASGSLPRSFWASDKIDYVSASHDLVHYEIPQVLPSNYQPIPDDIKEVPIDWARHTHKMIYRLRGALSVALTISSFARDQEEASAPRRRRARRSRR